jgi:hypothetical protein
MQAAGLGAVRELYQVWGGVRLKQEEGGQCEIDANLRLQMEREQSEIDAEGGGGG